MCLVYAVYLQFFLPHPAYPPGHSICQCLPLFSKLCLIPKCGLTIPEFTEAANSLDLIEPKIVMVQFNDQMTSESSMTPVGTSAPQCTFTVGLRLQFRPKKTT